MRTLTHKHTPLNACTHTHTHTCAHTREFLAAPPHPWAHRCAISPWPEQLSTLQEKKNRPWLRSQMGSEQGCAIPRSIKELLEYGPGSIMKTATISWTRSKLQPLTVALFISGNAKCLACSFSSSYCNNTLRKMPSMYRWEGGGSERWSELPKVTRLHSGRART